MLYFHRSDQRMILDRIGLHASTTGRQHTAFGGGGEPRPLPARCLGRRLGRLHRIHHLGVGTDTVVLDLGGFFAVCMTSNSAVAFLPLAIRSLPRKKRPGDTISAILIRCRNPLRLQHSTDDSPNRRPVSSSMLNL